MTDASILTRLSQRGPTRGVADGTDLPPVSAAVVIGIGGSGIQTITRVRAAIHAERPDQAAIDSIRFLGIDAVDLGDQNPPLPPGVDLGTGEFFNLVESPFDASSYVRSQLPADEYLQQWWDPDYRPPMGPLTEGLKRERMLGRLAFHRVADDLVTRVQSAITAAVEIDQGHIGKGAEAPDVPTIPIYIVNSSSGGTGSSGFLTVVFAVWTAARSRGYYPEIRSFTYLPSVFRAATLRLPAGGVAAAAHDANAFAYFREVDHFLTHSSELGQYLGRPVEAGGPDIPDGELLKQVYLVGSTMRGLGEITRIEDLYEITAEALYQFLLTDAGRPLVGVDATNTDRALAEADRFGKPRRYCSLGVARVVFPGETYRRHLLMRYVDWFITEGLLQRPNDLRSIARNHELLSRLIDTTVRIDREALSIDAEDEVLNFLDIAEQGKAELERTADPASAQSLIGQVERQSPRVVRSVRDTAQARNRTLLAEFEDAITTSVFTTGHGVPFAEEVLELLAKRLTEILSSAEAELNLKTNGQVSAEARVHELLKELQAAHNRSIYERLGAKVASALGRGRTREDLASLIGQAIQSWAQAIYDGELAQARLDLVRAMADTLDTMRIELARTVQSLRRLSAEAQQIWKDDTLIGKDAGPKATTTLLPPDAQPEIEDSSLAVELFEAIRSEHADALSGEKLSRFVARWVAESGNRGFFSLGSAREAEAATAQRSLVESLLRDGRERALETGEGDRRRPRLPRDLPEASEADPDALTNAIAGLVRLSRSVCWSWEEGRLQIEAPEPGTRASGVRPSVTTVIAAHSSVEDLLEGSVDNQTKLVATPDQERIVALSTEWAVPIHALHDVETWKAAYWVQQRRRRNHPDRIAPAHIDKRFSEALDPLIPEYFDRTDAARLLGQALIFGSLLKAEDQALLYRYEHSRSRPPVPAIHLDPAGSFRGRVIRIQQGRLVPDDEDIDLGTSWVDAIKGVGTNPVFRSSLEDLAVWMAQTLGAQRLLDELGTFVPDILEPLIDAKKSSPDELEVLTQVFDGLASWEVDLRNLIAVG